LEGGEFWVGRMGKIGLAGVDGAGKWTRGPRETEFGTGMLRRRFQEFHA